jgi:integrase/recombinase XerD
MLRRNSNWVLGSLAVGALAHAVVTTPVLRKRIAVCATDLATLRDKHIHPHSLRHTTAIHLLKAGVDFATISQWLGHASLNTTMAYARANLDLKRQALMQVFPDAPRPPRAGRVSLERLDVAGWLRQL